MRVSSRNHTDPQRNLGHSRSGHKKGKDAVTAGHTGKVTALYLHLTPRPWHSTVLNLALQASTSMAGQQAAHCPEMLLRRADPARGKEAGLELTALITCVIIYLVHDEMERALPGPGAAGSSSGAEEAEITLLCVHMLLLMLTDTSCACCILAWCVSHLQLKSSSRIIRLLL